MGSKSSTAAKVADVDSHETKRIAPAAAQEAGALPQSLNAPELDAQEQDLGSGADGHSSTTTDPPGTTPCELADGPASDQPVLFNPKDFVPYEDVMTSQIPSNSNATHPLLAPSEFSSENLSAHLRRTLPFPAAAPTSRVPVQPENAQAGDTLTGALDSSISAFHSTLPPTSGVLQAPQQSSTPSRSTSARQQEVQFTSLPSQQVELCLIDLLYFRTLSLAFCVASSPYRSLHHRCSGVPLHGRERMLPILCPSRRPAPRATPHHLIYTCMRSLTKQGHIHSCLLCHNVRAAPLLVF